LAEDFSKVSQILPFSKRNATQKFDSFRSCESFLDSSIGDDDPELKIDGYDFKRAATILQTQRKQEILSVRQNILSFLPAAAEQIICRTPLFLFYVLCARG